MINNVFLQLNKLHNYYIYILQLFQDNNKSVREGGLVDIANDPRQRLQIRMPTIRLRRILQMRMLHSMTRSRNTLFVCMYVFYLPESI